MKRISAEDMKGNVSAYLRLVLDGETLVIMQGDKAVAEMKPLAEATSDLRPFGLCAGEFTVPEGFDAPLPLEILDAFES